MWNFYSMIGSNGVVIVDSWAEVCKKRKLIHKSSVKGFDTFHEAEGWALVMFADRFPLLADKLLYLRVNRPVFTKFLQSNYM